MGRWRKTETQTETARERERVRAFGSKSKAAKEDSARTLPLIAHVPRGPIGRPAEAQDPFELLSRIDIRSTNQIRNRSSRFAARRCTGRANSYYRTLHAQRRLLVQQSLAEKAGSELSWREFGLHCVGPANAQYDMVEDEC